MPVDRYSSYDGDDPAGSANADQAKAEAVERLNKSHAFVVVTTRRESSDVFSMSSFAPGVHHNPMLESLAKTLWTIYYNDVFSDGLPTGPLGGLLAIEAIDAAMLAFANAGEQALHEMREAGLL